MKYSQHLIDKILHDCAPNESIFHVIYVKKEDGTELLTG
jgi:hypothetical protein